MAIPLTAPSGAGGEAGYLSLLLALAIVIVSAKVLGEVSVRLGQPAVLGGLIAGLLLGPSVFNFTSLELLRGEDVGLFLHQLGQLGALVLMLSAGMEIELSELRQSGKPALFAGIAGVLMPILLGVGLGLLFDFPLAEAIFVGIILAATSVSISAQTLLDIGHLRTPEGVAMLGAAVIDDVLDLIALSIFFSLVGGDAGLGGVGADLVRMVLVLAGTLVLSLFVLPRLANLAHRVQVSQGVFTLALVGMLFLAWATEFIGGLAAITGAFIAGLGLGRSRHRVEIEQGIHAVAYGFLVPLFLVDIGLQANLRQLGLADLGFGLLLIAVAVISKVIGAASGARLGGFDGRSALRVGVGMISRGEVGLIVASAGLALEVIDIELFNAVLLMVLVTTLLTPPLLRALFTRRETKHAPAG
jgi:Na+:H+ antiporter